MGKARVFLALLLALSCIVLLAGTNGLGRVDWAVYDWANRKLAQPPRPDILLVTIDDPSLQEVGRWPWPRTVLAELIDVISAGEPAAIGVDVLLSELSPDVTQDQRLVASLRQSGKVVLPMFSAADSEGGLQAMMPALPFARAAAGVGHVLVEADQDGAVRSAFLEEGWSDQRWEHFAVQLLRVAGVQVDPLPGRRAPGQRDQPGVWYRDHWVHIPFRAEPGYVRIPAADVLRGAVDAARWQGSIVLIGATATGLGDAYPTAVSQDTRYMPGVEISANLLDALRSGQTWQWAPTWLSVLLTLLLTALSLPFIAKSRPWGGLLVMAAALLLMAGLMLGLLGLRGLIWPPMAAAFSVLGLYFLWNARRLEFALQYLLKELKHIRKLLPDADRRSTDLSHSPDVVNRDILRLADASERLRTIHQVIRTVIEGLPDAALLVGADEKIIQMNERAKALILRNRQTDESSPAGTWGQVFAGVHLISGEGLSGFWQAQCRRQQPDFEAEIAYPGGKRLWLKAVECRSDPSLEGAYIVSLVDITSLRAAEKERDEALRFLSHDLRSPQASILSLVQLLRRPETAPPLPESLSRISSYASRTIALAEGFVEQARLANQPLRWHPCDLGELLQSAVDECWAQASEKGIEVELPQDMTLYWSVAAGDLLFRSLINLINNAIKYSPASSTVRTGIARRGQGWSMWVEDEGRGMSPDDLARLRRFEAFTRIAAREGESEESGFGLGLRFVDMVAKRHAGFLEIESELGCGSRFTLNIWIDQAEPSLEGEQSSYNEAELPNSD